MTVLSPELAEGLSAERFAREVRLAARLQHPNIVPVLAAGAFGALPYAESAALMDRVAAVGRGTWVEHSASAYACALRGDAGGVRRWAVPGWYLDFIALDEMKPLPIAEAYAQVGDADRALELLAVAVRNGLTDEAFLARHNPMLAPLRGDPRFQRLLEACRVSNGG